MTLHRFFVQTGVTALLVISVLRSASAQVLFDNFGPGNTFQINAGLTQGFFRPPVVQGMGFTPTVSAHLSCIDLAISLSRGPNVFVLRLLSDNAGMPGALLEEWTVVGQMGTFGTVSPIISVTSVNTPFLSAGSQYWVVPFATSATHAVWNYNITGDFGPLAASNDGGITYTILPNQRRGAFRVLGGTPAVPEPGPFSLLLATCAGASLLVRRRHNA
ncbi:MAG: choice-of-anchor R domain-containing protein [Chloroherpetonaceae bacterium]|nr:hypothetical protein [Chthonomonadaceae bacterium]MDW8207333.1 choice-of-anchor R domain-containing protein [Chloroherpetonaceae bacterium]